MDKDCVLFGRVLFGLLLETSNKPAADDGSVVEGNNILPNFSGGSDGKPQFMAFK